MGKVVVSARLTMLSLGRRFGKFLDHHFKLRHSGWIETGKLCPFATDPFQVDPANVGRKKGTNTVHKVAKSLSPRLLGELLSEEVTHAPLPLGLLTCLKRVVTQSRSSRIGRFDDFQQFLDRQQPLFRCPDKQRTNLTPIEKRLVQPRPSCKPLVRMTRPESAGRGSNCDPIRILHLCSSATTHGSGLLKKIMQEVAVVLREGSRPRSLVSEAPRQWHSARPIAGRGRARHDW